MKFTTSAALNQRIERITPAHLVVGVDIAKETHVARAVNCRGIDRGRPCVFTNNDEGYAKLQRWMQETMKEHQLSHVIIGLESTGHYWFNLADWLHGQGIERVLVSPLTTKRNKENRDNRPSKNDFKDAATIAEVVSRGFYFKVPEHEAIYLQLRAAVNTREFWAEEQARLSNRLQRALDIIFPEFRAVFSEWQCPRGIATLKAFPLPADLCAHNAASIVAAWKMAGMQRAGGVRGLQKAAELLAAARRSVGCTTVASEMKREVVSLIAMHESITAELAAHEKHLQALLQEVPEATVQPLQSIGLSPLITAVVLANAGDLCRFAHGRQLLALAGLSLAECTSGKRKGQIVLSKRGRRQLRKYLYLAVIGLVANHEAFKRWHAYNVGTLKMKKQRSIFKLIGKLARMLVAMARTGETFDPAKADLLKSSSVAA